jgi:hypothetical protein
MRIGSHLALSPFGPPIESGYPRRGRISRPAAWANLRMIFRSDKSNADGSPDRSCNWFGIRTGALAAEKVTVVKPASGPFLKGRMGPYGSLEFGIEAYYVQEGTGRVYEQAIRDRQRSAELAVSFCGQAALRGLRIE